jgi:O-antigen/teichoic acid export membrane protein
MSRYLTSAVEQALWSLLQLGVNLVLIRLIAPGEYGAFVFWANAAFVLSSVQNALTVVHIQVLAPGDGRGGERLAVERLMFAVNLIFLALVASSIAAANGLLHIRSSPLFAPAAALFVPAFLLQQYVRVLLFSRGRPAQATLQTGAVLILSAALLSGAVLTRVHLTVDGALLGLGAVYGLVGVTGAVRARRGQGAGFDWRRLGEYIAYARQSAWIFLGVITTEILTRYFVFAILAAHGPVALATLSATQLLTRPIPLLASSWSMVARNDLASRREEGDRAAFLRLLLLALAGGAVVAIVWTGLVYGGWSLISRYLFGGKYLTDGWLVPLWGVAAAVSFGQVAISAGLQVLRAFRALAIANTVAAVGAIAAMTVLIGRLGDSGAIIGTATGQAIELVVMSAILLRLLGRPPGSQSRPQSAG